MARIDTYARTNKDKRWIVGALAVFFVISSITFWLVFPFPSDEKVEDRLSNYAIVFKGEVFEEKAINKDGIYLSFEFIKAHIDPDIYYDEGSSSVIVTTEQSVYQMPSDSNQVFLNHQPTELSFPATASESGSVYVSTEWMSDVYPVQVDFHEDTKIIEVNEHNQVLQQARVVEEDEDVRRIRTDSTVTSPFVYEAKQGEQVTIEGEENGFYIVRTSNGIGGFVKKSALTLIDPRRVTVSHDKQGSPFQPQLEWPIHVTWDQLVKNEPLPSLSGVQVLSPTWFKLQNEDGDIRNIASKRYVQDAEEKGYRIWALFSNGFDPDITEGALATYEKRKSMIEQLLYFADIYNLDGINIDFENVYEKDGSKLTQFVRELTPLAHQQGLVVSVDISFISGSAQWSKFYEREKLSETADYIMVMAYDEHWGSSPVAGSVSSLPWVRNNLERVLEVVPHDKLILGAPLYTRLWKEETVEDGSIDVRSEAMTMEEAQDWMEEKGVTSQYDPSTEQDYVEFTDQDQDITYKMWLENETSLNKRAQLVHQYQLAGLATWSRYFADEEAFKSIETSLSNRKMVEETE